MRDIKTALYEELAADETLLGLLGATNAEQRIFEGTTPEEQPTTCVLYHFLSSLPPYGKREEELYRVAVWAEDFADADAIYERIDALLNCAILTSDNRHILWCHRDSSPSDLFSKEFQKYYKGSSYRIVSIPKT